MHISQSTASLLSESSCPPHASLRRIFAFFLPEKHYSFLEHTSWSSLCLKGSVKQQDLVWLGHTLKNTLKLQLVCFLILILTIMPKCLRRSWPQHVNSLGKIVSYTPLREPRMWCVPVCMYTYMYVWVHRHMCAYVC